MSGEHDFDAGSNVGEDRLPGAESAAAEAEHVCGMPAFTSLLADACCESIVAARSFA